MFAFRLAEAMTRPRKDQLEAAIAFADQAPLRLQLFWLTSRNFPKTKTGELDVEGS